MLSKPFAVAEPDYDVWARALVVLVDLAEMRGVPTARVFDGLPFDSASLHRLRSIAWSDYCVACERLEANCGTPEAAQDFFAQSYHHVLPEFRGLVGVAVSPTTFARVTLEILSPIVYPACAFSVANTGPDRIRVELRLRPAARSCLTFFRATVGELRALPRHLGLAEAEVAAEYGDRFGSYDVRLPRSNSIADRITRRVEVLLTNTTSATPVSLSFGGPTGGAPGDRLTAARTAWALTPRQVQVLELLVGGGTNKEIAQQLGCAENTVELHVTGLFKKAGVSSRSRLIADYYRCL